MSRDRLLLHILAVLLTIALAHGARAGEIEDTVTQAAERHGVSPWVLVAVAHCESPGLDPYAVGREGELGLFQLAPAGLLPLFYRQGYTDPWDAWQQSDFTARAFANGLARHWSCYHVAVLGQRPPWWR